MAILGAFLLAVVAVMTLLIICGAPLGEFTMGGRYKILPRHLRFIAVISLLIQVMSVIIILQGGGIIELWFSKKFTKYICMFMGIYLCINTVMNFFSTSKKERYFATPLSIITAVCFLVTAMKIY